MPSHDEKETIEENAGSATPPVPVQSSDFDSAKNGEEQDDHSATSQDPVSSSESNFVPDQGYINLPHWSLLPEEQDNIPGTFYQIAAFADGEPGIIRMQPMYPFLYPTSVSNGTNPNSNFYFAPPGYEIVNNVTIEETEATGSTFDQFDRRV